MIEKFFDGVFWTVIIGGFALMLAGIVGAYHVDKERQAFIEVCETMGGVPLIGDYGTTKACLKSEALK